MGTRKGVMLCYPFEEARLIGCSRKCWGQWPVLVQPKLDGIRCKINIESLLMISSEENPIFSMPHIKEAVEKAKNFFEKYEITDLDGELYSNEMSFEDICSCVLRDEPVEKGKQIKYHIFDFLTKDNTRTNASRYQVLGLLEDALNYFKLDEHFVFVPTFWAHSLTEVYKMLASQMELGNEGIIVRHPYAFYSEKRVTTMLKFKPKKSDTYKIVNYVQLMDKYKCYKPLLGALVLTDPEGNIFNVGTGFTEKQRQDMWQNRESLLGKYCTITYQNLTQSGVPRFAVYCKLEDSNPEGNY